VVRLEIAVRQETTLAVYSGYVALFAQDSVSASLHPGVALADVVMAFARMVPVE